MTPGLIVAAPASGSGKTIFTLGLLRRLAVDGVRVAPAKAGPDYIDPGFHAAAAGRGCLNLDSWAMPLETLAALVGRLGEGAELIVCEGVMGLFDGARVAAGEPDGSTADLAAATGWPVLLVVDVRGQGASAAAVVSGFARHRPGIAVAGVVFNQVAGEAHRRVVEAACRAACPEVAILGFLPRSNDLRQPSRHLGLVQACERPDLAAFVERAAGLVGAYCDIAALRRLARSSRLAGRAEAAPPLAPLGQRIAVARDDAFAFAYPAVLEGWRRLGVQLDFFSPLADEAPERAADAVYLPGGYPELHAGRLAANRRFLDGLRLAAAGGAAVFGECGGYMVLGRLLVDGSGAAHEMAGLLPLETSFAERRLQLGYRRAEILADGPLGRRGARLRGHQFHYATVRAEGPGRPLFAVADAGGGPLGTAGMAQGTVMGSFVHLVAGWPSG